LNFNIQQYSGIVKMDINRAINDTIQRLYINMHLSIKVKLYEVDIIEQACM